MFSIRWVRLLACLALILCSAGVAWLAVAAAVRAETGWSVSVVFMLAIGIDLVIVRLVLALLRRPGTRHATATDPVVTKARTASPWC